MIGVYIRVSTVGQNLEGQKQEIQRWLDNNASGDVVWFEDKTTGDNLDRPGFEALQKRVFLGDIDTIVVFKLDRLSRSLVDGLTVLADWCERGIRVVSVTQQIDFNGAMGKMLAAVLLGVAEMEQETRRERQAAGIEAAKARGVYKGRKKGATKGSPSKAKRLHDKGLTSDEIARSMGVKKRTVLRYLKEACS